ncbi:hypothetical protein GCM10009809_23930 [Isoptericola hypogeus]|uniref:HNH nuclease domain-containing protein n=1 Tax=Isoptericola hypogeus TaxID=300179 RepID=A0ABP4VJY2_9MICO
MVAHAIDDRLAATAARLRADGDGRQTSELRADVLTDLLLDDGTLDLSTATFATAPAPAVAGSAAGRRPHREHGGTVSRSTQDPPSTPAASVPADPLDDEVRPRVGSLAPLARSIRPRVTVTVPVLTLLGVSQTPATLDGHIPIDADAARALCAHAPSFRRILTHPETGTPLSVGRSTYAVPADLRALLAERDRTCRFPGCTRAAYRTDLDHTTAWADGGTTAADNLAHLCRRHHTAKHQTTWQVRQVRTPDAPFGGELEWTSPTGRVHRTSPTRPVTSTHRTLPRPFLPSDEGVGDDAEGAAGTSLPADPLGDDPGPPPF